MEAAIQKGYGYVTRVNDGRRQVLVFDHVEYPEAGTQVPGGSLEEGEEPLAGILREVTTAISHS